MKYKFFEVISILTKGQSTKDVLNLHNFFNIVDRVSLEHKLKKIFFSAKALSWYGILDALNFLKQKKIKAVLYTEGETLVENFYYPANLEVNLRKYLESPQNRKNIENNIRQYQKISHININLRFSFHPQDSENEVNLIKKLAQKLNLELKIQPRGIILPKSTLENFQQNILQTIKQSNFFGISDKSRILRIPTPLCLNVPKEYKTINSCFDCPVFMPTFHHNGQTLTFCEKHTHNFDFKKSSSLFQLSQKILQYQQKSVQANQPFANCQTCKLIKKCQGGCLLN